MNDVYLLLGTNIGERLENINNARILIEKRIGKLIKCSSIYETEPWGVNNQRNYFNQVLKVNSEKPPYEILSEISIIEENLKRDRKNNIKWASRTIDVDILFYNDFIIEEEDLIVPHPLIPERRFALIPLNEIAKDYIHPVLQKKIELLLKECKDVLSIKKYFIN